MFKYTAFTDTEKLVQGYLEHVALSVKNHSKLHPAARMLVFSDTTGRQIDLDLSGSDKDILERLKKFAPVPPTPTTGAGRPKLGVVPREISLLPQHWEWLHNQDGGASSVIRRLIDEKMKPSVSNVKMAQEVTYKFLSAIAEDLPQFEDATRYLYRRDKKKFHDCMSEWPSDIRDHADILAQGVFE